mmetsp:Transcript_38458/g.96743  ORF Transcript_38458/g.96743 Transcript_38458/m.96743 type:complete len:183 (-) Transcript_38458:745-1293(-)
MSKRSDISISMSNRVCTFLLRFWSRLSRFCVFFLSLALSLSLYSRSLALSSLLYSLSSSLSTETKRKHMLETIDKIKSHARTHRKSERTMNAGMIASRQKRMYHLGQTKTAQGTRYKLSYMDKRPVIQATRLPKRVHLIVPTIPDPLLKENAIVLSNVTLRVGDKDILQQVDCRCFVRLYSR